MVGKVGLCRIRTHKVCFVKFWPYFGYILPVVTAWKSAMRARTLLLLTLSGVGSAACSRTTLDNAATGASACGDKVLDGYLVDAWACQNPGNSQGPSSTRLPAYQSQDGLGCSLDIYLSEQLPATAIPEVCGGEPFTSRCFLEAIGLIEIGTRLIVGYPRVSLVGSMQTADVCSPIAKCAPMRPECEECKQQAIFVPCQATLE